MRKNYEGSVDGGQPRDGYPGNPFAGNPITSHDELLDFYFQHPTSCVTEQPLGSLHGVADSSEDYT